MFQSVQDALEVVFDNSLKDIKEKNIYIWDDSQEKLHQLRESSFDVFPDEIAITMVDLNSALNTPNPIVEVRECIRRQLQSSRESAGHVLIIPAVFEHNFYGAMLISQEITNEDLEDSSHPIYIMIEQSIASYLHHRSVVNAAQLSALGEIALDVVHSVRSSLTGTGAYLGVLAKSDDTERSEIISTIREEINRLHKLTDAFRHSPDYRALKVGAYNINHVLDAVLLLFHKYIADRGITVIKQYDADLPPAKIDFGRIKGAILHIVLNGLQAMEAGGQLTVTTTVHSTDFLKVEITDTGCGMSPEVRERIFDPFYTTKDEGTGLGLPASKKIIEEHGGQIYITSKTNQGTTVSILLPAIKLEETDE
jgi:signal transduction histidine kinase